MAGKYSSTQPTTNVRRRGILRRKTHLDVACIRENRQFANVYETWSDRMKGRERKRRRRRRSIGNRGPVRVERVECIEAMIARADSRSPSPLARPARPRFGTVGQVGRSRNAQTADSRALRLRNPCREKVSPPVPVPASFQRSSHRHVGARDPQLHLPSTVYKQILPPFEAASPRLHVDVVDRPVTTASSRSPTIDPSRPGPRS